ncbi:S-layer homology domain-containing protein [Paenibacillus sp. Marseille-Q4541]|uniref:S-layer homology domain-containing protein n=1 Tax=Paenibacillus sp. Marseille-Q4541 TaxID=2831522 RepID=UPI001BAB7E5A|nr:S-layer homology domain-containing protein [Paenibacillus sp. Marseille-Q4541]
MKRTIKRITMTCTALILLTTAIGISRPELTEAASVKKPFYDISASYAEEAILRLYKNGIVSGTSSHYFEPGKKLTRAELSTMIVRALRLIPVKNDLSPFLDMKKTDWYYGDIHALVNLEMMKGRSTSRFEPQSAVTREEAAAIMTRMLKTSPPAVTSPSELPYYDSERISAWARSSVAKVTELGYMQGDNHLFYPQRSLIRAEAAVLIDRILETPTVKNALRMKPVNKVQLGWQYDSTTAQFEQQVLSSGINTLSPRWFFLDEDNLVKSNVEQRLINFATTHKLDIWGMVGNRSDAELTHRILSSPAKRELLVQKLVSSASNYGLAGLNIDFENVKPEDRDYLSAFIASLYPKLKSNGIILSIDVSPDLGSSWTAAFDYEMLGKNTDYVILMAYEEHWNGSTNPGSVSSLPWLKSGIQKLMKVMDKEHIIVALPTYTRDWSLADPIKGSYDITLQRQGQIYSSNRRALHWDSICSQYTLTYTNTGSKRKIWTEDSRSLSAKVRLSEQLGVAGYAYWYMGSETKDIWPAINNTRIYENYRFQLD